MRLPWGVEVAVLVCAVIAVGAVRSLPTWRATEASRAVYGAPAANGVAYPYLVGMDSYSWVRKARNYLASGSPCDVVVAGDCRDLLRHAPVGSTMPYADSLHVQAIAWLHRAFALVDPGRPVEASAFWVQVLVGMLGAIGAWAVARQLAGAWAGLLAAVLVGMHPSYLARSLGADNDVWHPVLPLWAVAALLAALASARPRGQFGWAVVASGVIALHAAIWSGWQFGFVVLVAGLVGCVAWSAGTGWASGGWPVTVARGAGPMRVAGAFLACTLTLVVLRGGIAEIGTVVGTVVEHATATPAPAAASDVRTVEVPNALRDAGELRVIDFGAVQDRLGGPAILIGALVGLVLLVVPAGATPPVATYGAIVIAVWLGAALVQCLAAQRWLLLAVAPVGVGFAAGVGRLVDLVQGRTTNFAVRWAPMVVAAVPVAFSAQAGFGRALAARPDLNDAWTATLREIRESAPPDAIVNAFWPYGYWIAYFGERGVAADGSSLLKRIPHWFGQAMLTSDPARAIGLLRMLNCGSDAWPEAEGARGAYERLRAAGADDLQAYDLVLALASLDRVEADRLLERRAFSAAARAEILAATHCTPRPAYLILSDKQARQPALRYQGTWDPRRAAVAGRLRTMPEDEAVAIMVDRLEMPETDARRMFQVARALDSDAARDEFVAPTTGYYKSWVPCRPNGARLVCTATNLVGRGLSLELTFDESIPGADAAALRFERDGRAMRQPLDAVLVADATGVRDLGATSSASRGLGVLIDPRAGRALFGPPVLLRSVLTRLLLYEGRGLPGFEKVADHRAAGERVLTWRIEWPES